MKAAIIQYDPKYLQVEDNLARVEKLLGDVHADLIVLPELFATGYFFRNVDDLRSVAEPVPDGPTCRKLVDWSRDRASVFVAGFPETSGGRLFNSAVVVTPEGVLGTYRKVHLFYEEKKLFEAGDLGFRVFDLQTRDGESYRLGIMICFDWYFPEAARSLALSGADVIAHPSNLVRKDCPRSMPIRALENHVFTLTSNRIGHEFNGREELSFIGRSLICDPEGEVLASASADEEMVLAAEIEPLRARNRRITAYNDLFADRRPDVYVGSSGSTL